MGTPTTTPRHSPLHPLELLADKSKTDKSANTKGRSFTAACLGWVSAPCLAYVHGDPTAPVFIGLAGPPTTLKPFAANFLHGEARAAVRGRHDSVRHLLQRDKGVTLRHRWRRDGERSLILAWHEAFELEPETLFSFGRALPLTFVHMPRRAWITQQAERFAGHDDPVATARAAHFCAYLSRRTRLPIANDPAFYRHLYDAAIEADWTAQATASTAILKVGLDAYEDPVLCRVEAKDFETWLRERTREFFGSTATATTRKAA